MGRLMSDADNTKDVLAAFASITRDGLILVIGESALTHCRSIVAGMHAMTRLVINLPQGAPATNEERELENDLRVAIHRQGTEEFLEDVKRHSLNLVVLGQADVSDAIVDRVSAMLYGGGSVVVLKRAGSAGENYRNAFQAFHRADIGSCELFVKRDEAQSKVRRGGRRARLNEI